MKRILLIDGDQFLFRATAAVEKEVRWDEWNHVLFSHPQEAWDNMTEMMERIYMRFDTEEHALCFSPRDGQTTFRYEVDPTYKNHRAGSRKPLCYAALREKCDEHYNVVDMPRLEADDVMGILATKPMKAECIIISQDKDMRTIPTTVWNGKDTFHITEAEADYFHMYQTLIGDTADGYKGCPGIGPKKAEALLRHETDTDSAAYPLAQMWASVVAAFVKAGLTEEDALVQARLARILRYSDWDGENKRPILWSPS